MVAVRQSFMIVCACIFCLSALDRRGKPNGRALLTGGTVEHMSCGMTPVRMCHADRRLHWMVRCDWLVVATYPIE